MHVIAYLADGPVEIQVRTQMQDQWAQIVERLGDQWGRQIRYGGDPDDPSRPLGDKLTRVGIIDVLLRLSDQIDALERWERSLDAMRGLLGALSSAGQEELDRAFAAGEIDEPMDLAAAESGVVESLRELEASRAGAQELLDLLARLFVPDDAPVRSEQ